MIILPAMKIAQGEPFSYSARVTGQSWVGYSGQVVFRLKRLRTQSAFLWNGFGYLDQVDPIVTATVTGDATGLMTFSLTQAQTLLFPALNRTGYLTTARFEITMGNGTTSRKYQGDVQVAKTLSTVIQPGTGDGGVVVPPNPTIPPAVNVVEPSISGTGKIGAAHTINTGAWTGVSSFLYRWTANGSIIAGATAATFTPTAVENLQSIRGYVAGVSASGVVSAYIPSSNLISITYVGPTASGTIADVIWTQNTAIANIATASFFTGSSLTYSLAPAVPGVSINTSTGVISGTPTTVAALAALTVTVVNSGGSATRTFAATVIAAAATSTITSLAIVSNEFQFSATNSPTTFKWATTDDGLSTLSVAAILAGTGAYDFGSFAAPAVSGTVTLNLPSTPPGARKFHAYAINGSGNGTPNAVSFAMALGNTVPFAFTSGQWTWTDSPSAGGDKISLNILTLASDGGSAITALQYSLNGGAYTTMSGLGTGVRLLTVPASALATLKIRAVNAIGNGPDSDTKSATSTVGSAYTRFKVATNGTARHSFAADSAHREAITVSAWLKPATVSGQAIILQYEARSEFRRFTTSLNISIVDSAGVERWNISAPNFFAAGTEVHMWCQVSLTGPTAVLKKNGVTLVSGTDYTVNTALAAGTGLLYMATSTIRAMEADNFFFDGEVSDLVVHHTTSAAKPTADYYNAGAPFDPTSVGTPYILLGGGMKANDRAGNAAQGFNDNFNLGSGTATTVTASYTDA